MPCVNIFANAFNKALKLSSACVHGWVVSSSVILFAKLRSGLWHVRTKVFSSFLTTQRLKNGIEENRRFIKEGSIMVF